MLVIDGLTVPESITVKARSYEAALEKICNQLGLIYVDNWVSDWGCSGQIMQIAAEDGTHQLPIHVKRGSQGHRGEYTVTFEEVTR